MPTHALLLSIAFKAELAQSRRLVKSGQFSDDAALKRVLLKQAGDSGLDALVLQRQSAHQKRISSSALRRQRAADKALRRQTKATVNIDAGGAIWRAWFDGSAHPNPGKIGIGALLISPTGERTEISERRSDGDNNEAEFHALQSVLSQALASGADILHICGDSRVVIDALNAQKNRAFPSAILQTHYLQSLNLIRQFKDLRLNWIPREKNAEADALSQAAIQKIL
ncbi:ribonuclease HI family protein [Undibacterium sp. Jales W-56]|uniref:ribonuclease HI family protein n=1 Tax=Undibacterium sp. Jales W-56 TaxID=2897325 RepID=UPI0021D348EA|nr:ribonuclease HI family protein [Undibacterium sp. Jales W-56]MCU6434524.1 ribonuclease HI family protein [Undibacterium sp. Jales W-56]